MEEKNRKPNKFDEYIRLEEILNENDIDKKIEEISEEIEETDKNNGEELEI